jgi:hypothetical protein
MIAHTRFALAVVVDSATALCGSDYTERGELAAQADASRLVFKRTTAKERRRVQGGGSGDEGDRREVQFVLIANFDFC